MPGRRGGGTVRPLRTPLNLLQVHFYLNHIIKKKLNELVNPR